MSEIKIKGSLGSLFRSLSLRSEGPIALRPLVGFWKATVRSICGVSSLLCGRVAKKEDEGVRVL